MYLYQTPHSSWLTLVVTVQGGHIYMGRRTDNNPEKAQLQLAILTEQTRITAQNPRSSEPENNQITPKNSLKQLFLIKPIWCLIMIEMHLFKPND